ncbi:MAG: hypothetical protein KA354_08010 [Phycisphaerae bacterium]|nr:hypothetical protein [Phycisphaerae bacterium]
MWRWTKPKYRHRAVALLLFDALLFAGLCCFILWLRTGQYVIATSTAGPAEMLPPDSILEPAGQADGVFDVQGDTTVGSYVSPSGGYWQAWWAVFDPSAERQATLIDFLISPIPLDQVPLIAVIIGLAMATLTAVPIMVSMLYRFPYSLIFCLLIAFVALLPWLGLTMVFCCLLARWRPLRFSFHYATALVSFLPVVFYYFMATRNAAAFDYLPRIEIAKLYVPWVLAIVAACIFMAITLMIAWIVNYRPGAIAPLLAMMFAIPVVLFEVKVGRDELYYRLLESRFGPGSNSYFVENADASQALARAVRKYSHAGHNPSATPEAIAELVALRWQFWLDSAFTKQQEEAQTACDTFRRSFPRSRYTPNVLYLKARAIDMQIDREFFRRNAILRYYSDYPSAASKSVWREIYNDVPRSPIGAVAALRLAILEGREGHIDQAGPEGLAALMLLDDLLKHPPEPVPGASASEMEGGLRAFFAKRSPTGTLGIDPSATLQDARKFQYLLTHNTDPEQNNLALRRLLSLMPRHALYHRNLVNLRADIAAGQLITRLWDNIEVLIAATEPSSSLRIDGLVKCVEKLQSVPQSDALSQARYELGVAYKDDNRHNEAGAAFEDVVRLHADTPWATDASRRLAAMGLGIRSGGDR